MELLISILGAACITNLWINSEPTMKLREWIFKDKNNMLRRLLDCAMCSGAWIGLGITQNVLHAAIIAIVAEVISRQLNSGRI